MGSSPGFASTTRDSCRRLKDSLSLRLGKKLLAAHRDSLGSFYKGTPSPSKVLRLLGGARFQALFHSPLGVLFTFPSRYWFAIGRGRVFSLGGWSPCFARGFTCPALLWATGDRCQRPSGYGALPCSAGLPQAVPLDGWFVTAAEGCGPRFAPPNNTGAETPRTLARAPVWAGPVSLAATPGISVDFSSSYLDVSVPRLPPGRLWVRRPVAGRCPAGFPIRESADHGRLRLPRGLSQLAAPFVDFRAKASASRPCISS